MTPSGVYRHARVAQGPFFHPKDAMRHNHDISGAWTTFVRSASRRRVWSVLMTRSAQMFGLSWERKPRRDRVFSRPGRDLTLRNNFWQISKTRLPRPLTSPVASLAIRKHFGMHPHPWTSCLGLDSYLSPSDMALHPGNIQGYNNEIQIAGSDAAIGHNPLTRQSRSPPRAIRHSKERSPHQPGPFTRGRSLRRTRRESVQLTTTALQQRNDRARRPTKKKKRPLWPLG